MCLVSHCLFLSLFSLWRFSHCLFRSFPLYLFSISLFPYLSLDVRLLLLSLWLLVSCLFFPELKVARLALLLSPGYDKRRRGTAATAVASSTNAQKGYATRGGKRNRTRRKRRRKKKRWKRKRSGSITFFAVVAAAGFRTACAWRRYAGRACRPASRTRACLMSKLSHHTTEQPTKCQQPKTE